jgi:ubiquitin-protein ligase
MHCNINTIGNICLNILKTEEGGWRAALGVETILLSVRELLAHPNPCKYKFKGIAEIHTL